MCLSLLFCTVVRSVMMEWPVSAFSSTFVLSAAGESAGKNDWNIGAEMNQ